VISGINLGFNASLPLILGSGTIAAATEGAFAGLTAIAFSLAIAPEEFREVSVRRGRRDDQSNQITQRAARRALEITDLILTQSSPKYSVHNINFPADLTKSAPLNHTKTTLSDIPSLFAPVNSKPETPPHPETRLQRRRFVFQFAHHWPSTYNPTHSDLNTLQRGEISHTLIRWNDAVSFTHNR
jgi:5'/3'-nucleotidase SurE